MSGGIKQTLKNAADPLDIFGGSGSSIAGNVLDPGNFGGMGQNGFPTQSGHLFGSSPFTKAPVNPNVNPATGANYGATAGALPPNYLGSNAGLPTSAGYGSPSMSGYGFNYYGGQAPQPQGGYYNQMAQAMAGPSYAPAGTSWANQRASGWPPGPGTGKGALPGLIGSVMAQSPFGNPLNPASLNPNFSPSTAAQSVAPNAGAGGRGLSGLIGPRRRTAAF